MHIPSLQTLRAFDAAGRLQSYSRAGEELGLTHGAISRRMRDLEALTGERLFERKGNRMVPTREGKRLLEQVRNALGLLESIFVIPASKSRRRVTISLFPALARWLVPRLGSLRRELPDLDLKFDLSAQIVDLGHGIDAAIRYGNGSWPDTQSRRLATEIFFPVCSPTYLSGHKLQEPADLLRCTLLRHPWHSWATWFQAAGVAAGEPPGGPEYSDSSMLIEAAIAGEGVALGRGLGVADALRTGALVRLFSVSVPDERAYFFVTPPGRRNSTIDAIEAWVAAELGQAAGTAREES